MDNLRIPRTGAEARGARLEPDGFEIRGADVLEAPPLEPLQQREAPFAGVQLRLRLGVGPQLRNQILRRRYPLCEGLLPSAGDAECDLERRRSIGFALNDYAARCLSPLS